MSRFDVFGVVEQGADLRILSETRKFDVNPVLRGVADGLIYEFVVPHEENVEISVVAQKISALMTAPPGSNRFF